MLHRSAGTAAYPARFQLVLALNPCPCGLASGKGVMLTLWESEADLRALEASGWFQEEVARFQAVLGAPPSREEYEVSVTV